MKYNFVKTALIITSATVVLSATPIINIINAPVRVEASVSAEYGDDNFDFKKVPGYGTIKPAYPLEDVDFWHWWMYDSAATEHDTLGVNSSIREEALITVKGSSTQIKSGQNITKDIKFVNTVDDYMNRKIYYYRACKYDTGTHNPKETKLYYTAPCDGVMKMRGIYNESTPDYSGTYICMCDSSGKVLDWGTSDNVVIANTEGYYSGGYGSYPMKKGQTYTIKFASIDSRRDFKFEMFYMKTTGNGITYPENTWNVYNLDFKGSDMNMGESLIKERKLYNNMAITLKQDSVITMERKYLSYIYEDWNIDNLYDCEYSKVYVYKKSAFDAMPDSKMNDNLDAVRYKTFTYTRDVKTGTTRYKIFLPKGSYYIPISVGCTDVAFKYSVEPAVGLKLSKVSTIYENATKVKGTSTPKSTVYAKVNGKWYKATASSSGKFSIPVSKIEKNSAVYVKAKLNGLETDNYKYIAKADPFSKTKITVKTVNEKATKISGTCYKGTIVSVKVGSKIYQDTTTTSGKYSVKVPKLKKGAKVTITQKNKWGNSIHKKKVTVNALLKYYYPSVSAKKGKTYVSGTAFSTKGTVYVKIGSKIYKDTKLTNKKYKVITRKLKKGTKIRVWQKYKGVKSKVKTIKVK